MRNEKLVEATMLALRGKLLEEVDRNFEKVLDYINGDYHRVEDFTDLEVCYPNEEDTDWLDAYDVANELLNKLSKEDWATMAKEIDDGTLRDKLTDWGMKAGSLEEARSHKEDNERVAPRRQHSPYQSEYGRVYGDLKDVPKRARFSANKGNASDWGYYDINELDTYNKSTDDIEDYKRYKTDAENERALARYHNANAQEKDDIASDIVRDKKLDRAKRNLKGQEIFDVEEKKTESTEDVDTQNLNNIKDILQKSGITSERTLNLMSKDILNDLKHNYTKDCKDESGIYYGTVITDAFRKKVQQITGKMPSVKIGENRKIKEEAISRNRKIRKKVESLDAPVDDQAYWAYVLGYDFLQDYFKNSSEPECDLTFEKAWKIADDFMHSEEFQDTSKSGYDALVDYLKNNKLI